MFRPISVWLQVRLCQLGRDFPFPESILQFRQLQGHVSLPADRSRNSEVGRSTALAQQFGGGEPVPNVSCLGAADKVWGSCLVVNQGIPLLMVLTANEQQMRGARQLADPHQAAIYVGLLSISKHAWPAGQQQSGPEAGGAAGAAAPPAPQHQRPPAV